MSSSHWFAVAALAFLPVAATAQQALQQSNPADPDASVPASGYVSAFKAYRAATGENASPDKVWRAANEEVQGDGAHASHGTQPAPQSASQSGPESGPKSAPQSGPNPAPEADPHAGHQGHAEQNSKGK